MTYFTDYRFNSGSNIPFTIEVAALTEGKQ